ncbi:MAG: family serine peptidase [Mucilaginibacter sp.]|nr:family serine peptidase [Mucilaginibacter sp.]
MAQLKVVIDQLNQRNSIPASLPDPDSIVGVVNNGYTFQGTLVGAADIPNSALGTWYVDTNNFYYWGGGLVDLDGGDTNTVVNSGGNDQDEIVSGPNPGRGDMTPEPTNSIILSLQINKIWELNETGQNAIVAILDSGIALNCPDLSDAVGNGVNGGLASAGFRMKTFIEGDVSVNDDIGHGSHCAGLIASRNTEQSIGIAKGCSLYVGKIVNASTDFSASTIISGIRWAAGLDDGSPQDIDIISLSGGSLLNVPDMQPTIEEALSKGKILVFSIGNRDPLSLPQGGTYPALFDEVISVGAIDFENVFQDYSYQSSNLTIACPGTGILSYWLQGDTNTVKGTSQAAAICSGVIALLVSKLKKKGFNAKEIQDKIKKALLSSPTSSINEYTYRYLTPLQLYESL